MQCPYCDDEVRDLDEFNLHCLKSHPDKTSIATWQEDKIVRIWQTAESLSDMCLGKKGDIPKEQVLETFRYFLRELMKSEGDYGVKKRGLIG